MSTFSLLYRYQWYWRKNNIGRYNLKKIWLPKAFFFDTVLSFFRGFLYGIINKPSAENFTHIHAHDVAALSFAKGYSYTNKDIIIIYDSHELHAFRNRKNMSWLSGLLTISYEVMMTKDVKNIISVSPPILLYLRFFIGSNQTRFHLVINSFYKKKSILLDTKSKRPNDSCLIYIGSLIQGRGLDLVAAAAQLNQNKQYFFLCPEDNLFQRTCAERFSHIKNISISYGPYEDTLKYIMSIYGRCYGWLGIQDICLSYNFALPNKLFQYSVENITPIYYSSLYLSKLLQSNNIGFSCSSANEVNEILALNQEQKNSKTDQNAFKHLVQKYEKYSYSLFINNL